MRAARVTRVEFADLQFAICIAMLSSFASRLHARWGEASGSSNSSGVQIVSASAGTFRPRPGCQSPRLWLLLAGHYRTFHYTQESMARMAKASSSDCFMVAAASSPELCLPREHMEHGADGWTQELQRQEDDHTRNHGHGHGDGCTTWLHKTGPLPWREFARAIDDVPALLSTAQSRTFDGRFAYLIVRRHGALARRLDGQKVEWHAAWLAALWSQRVNGFEASGASVVLRTRFDFLYDHAFELGAMQRHFASPAGQHLALVSRWPGIDGIVADYIPNTDVVLATSYGSYANDFAAPIEHMALQHLAFANNWGVSWDYNEAIDGPRCAHGSCFVTAVEAEPLLSADNLLRNAVRVNASGSSTKVDLAARVHLICRNITASWKPHAEPLRKAPPHFSGPRLGEVYRLREAMPLSDVLPRGQEAGCENADF